MEWQQSTSLMEYTERASCVQLHVHRVSSAGLRTLKKKVPDHKEAAVEEQSCLCIEYVHTKSETEFLFPTRNCPKRASAFASVDGSGLEMGAEKHEKRQSYCPPEMLPNPGDFWGDDSRKKPS